MNFQTNTSNKYSDKSVYPPPAYFEKPTYSGIHLKKLNEQHNDSNKNLNIIKSLSLDYSNQQTSPRKRTSSKPPKPTNTSVKGESRKIESVVYNNPSSPLCEYSNDWQNNNGISKQKGNDSFSKSKTRANENALNNLCQRNNNFMTNDNTSRRSNSNQSRKSNNSVSSVSNYLDKRHQQTQEKLNKIKMEKIKKETEELKPFPQISENSKKIVETLNQGGNVVDRLTYAKFEKKSAYHKIPQNLTNNHTSQEINKIDRVLSQMKEANKELNENLPEPNRKRSDNNINIVKNSNEESDYFSPLNFQKKSSRESRRKNSRSNISNTSIDSNSSKKRRANSKSFDNNKQETKMSKPIKLKKSHSKEMVRNHSKDQKEKVKLTSKEKNLPQNENQKKENEIVNPNKERLIHVRKSLHDFLSTKQKKAIQNTRVNEDNLSKLTNCSLDYNKISHSYNNNNMFSNPYQDENKKSIEIQSKIYPTDVHNQYSNNKLFYVEESYPNNLNENQELNQGSYENNYNQNFIGSNRYSNYKNVQENDSRTKYTMNNNKNTNFNENLNTFTFQGSNFPKELDYNRDNNSHYIDTNKDPYVNNYNNNFYHVSSNVNSNVSFSNHSNKYSVNNSKVNNIKAGSCNNMLNENTRLLSNAEIFNLMKTNKHISEEEKIKILEEEMIKISKINGLQLQEPPMTYENYSAEYNMNPNEINKLKPDSNMIKPKDNNPVHRVTDNSIEYNSINTSNSEKHALQYNYKPDNQSKVIVNKSYNFKNPKELMNTYSEDIIKKNSIEVERTEKSLELTNDKLKVNNNAKNNLMNKMDYSSRDLSKFLNL